MGNVLATAQAGLSIENDPSARDAKEIFDSLEDMAQDRLDLFYEKTLHDAWDRHLIPIGKVLNKHTYVGIIEGGASALDPKKVQEAVNEFAAGPTADALSTLAFSTVAKMLGATPGRRQTTKRYAISMDALGGISRLDYFIFTYTFASTSLAAKKTSLVAYGVVESSAIVKDIDPNTLRVIINHAFKGGNLRHSALVKIYVQLNVAMFASVNEFANLSLDAEGGEELEAWFKSSTQQKGFQTIATSLSPTGANSGIARGDVTEGFSQSGFKPVEVTA